MSMEGSGSGVAEAAGPAREVYRAGPSEGIGGAPVATLLINYRTTDQTLRCLASLRGQTRAPAWIGILDNDPVDGKLRCALEALPPFEATELRLYESTVNLGFAGGCNALLDLYLAEAGCDRVLLLNNDTFAFPALVERLSRALDDAASAGMAGARVHELSRPGEVDTLGISLYRSLMPADRRSLRDSYLGPTGACALLTRSCLLEVEKVTGYFFDERFFCYCEDTDLVLRANLLGYRPLFIDDVLALHEGQASSAGAGSEFIAYHGLRNSLWMVAKNIPSWLLLKYGLFFLTASLMSIARYLLSGRPRVPLRVYRDALRYLPLILRDRRLVQAQRRISTRELDRRLCPRFYRQGYFREILRGGEK